MSDPRAVAKAYFNAVASRDVEGIKALFSPHAELVTVTGTMTGPEDIANFYRDLVFSAQTLEPHSGPFLIDGNRLAVEIELNLDGNVTLVADLFTITGGQIDRLAIFMGQPIK